MAQPRVDANIHRLSEVAWWHVKRCPGTMPPIPGLGILESLAKRWRGARKLKRFHRLSVKVAVPVLAVAVAAYLTGLWSILGDEVRQRLGPRQR